VGVANFSQNCTLVAPAVATLPVPSALREIRLQVAEHWNPQKVLDWSQMLIDLDALLAAPDRFPHMQRVLLEIWGPNSVGGAAPAARLMPQIAERGMLRLIDVKPRETNASSASSSSDDDD
jgi:hypothetical protein